MLGSILRGIDGNVSFIEIFLFNLNVHHTFQTHLICIDSKFKYAWFYILFSLLFYINVAYNKTTLIIQNLEIQKGKDKNV